jgi:hypothetical protein
MRGLRASVLALHAHTGTLTQAQTHTHTHAHTAAGAAAAAYVKEEAIASLLSAVDEEGDRRQELLPVNAIIAVAVTHAEQPLPQHAGQRQEAKKGVLVNGGVVVRARRLSKHRAGEKQKARQTMPTRPSHVP